MSSMLPLSEAQLKKAVWDYLQYKTNLGELYADRLNSGEVIVIAGLSRRRVKLCREGTADFMVIRQHYFDLYDEMPWPATTVMFLELKSEKGKQRPEQAAFQKIVEAQGASYFIVRSIEDLEAILEA